MASTPPTTKKSTTLTTVTTVTTVTNDDAVRDLLKAVNYAATMHRNQMRKSGGIPYINHPIDVMWKLAEIGQVTDWEILAAAVLHDTVEDCKEEGASIEDIRKLFGDVVAGFVDEVTDDKALSKVERKQHQIDAAASKSKGAKMIKMADKLSNLGDLRERPPKGWDAERIQGYFVWAWNVLQPMYEANENLAEELQAVFSGEFVYEGVSYPCLPSASQMKSSLERYMNSMKVCSDQ